MIRDANLYSGQTAECCQISTAKREGDHHSPRKWGKATGWLSNHDATLSQCMAWQVIVPSEQSRHIHYFTATMNDLYEYSNNMLVLIVPSSKSAASLGSSSP